MTVASQRRKSLHSQDAKPMISLRAFVRVVQNGFFSWKRNRTKESSSMPWRIEPRVHICLWTETLFMFVIVITYFYLFILPDWATNSPSDLNLAPVHSAHSSVWLRSACPNFRFENHHLVMDSIQLSAKLTEVGQFQIIIIVMQFFK